MRDLPTSTGAAGPLEERLIRALPRLRSHLAGRGARSSGGDVDDLAQEVMARALRYRENFDADRALWPWLRRLADNALSDSRHASARRPSLSDELNPAAPEADEHGDGGNGRETVARLVAQLPERERIVLLRFHQRGQSIREIATELGIPEGTVKSHLSRARRRLAEDAADGNDRGTSHA